MRSPKDMEIIQIDITNACVHKCSNCTRFCGHHKKPFFMEFETFKKAVDSLDDWSGCVGIIGGEPTIHPEFEKFANYIREKRIGKKLELSRMPIHDMLKHINDSFSLKSKAGLWSSLNLGYYKHFEIINDTFSCQLLNDHNNACQHQALLMSRKELGINDEEWIKKRDTCWIQNTWSAAITPKGAFFCEVAGALDMLFNGPGGWDVTKDWWKREPKDFVDQLHWCEICSGCLDVPKRISNDGRDDVTPLIFEKLKEVESPKAQKELCVIHQPEDYDKTKYKTFTGGNDYMEAGGNVRTTSENRNLYPKSFDVTNKENLISFIKDSKPKDWIILSSDKNKAQKVAKYIKDFIINPGCLYVCDGIPVFNVLALSIRDFINKSDNLDSKNISGYYPKDKIIKISIPKWYNNILSIKNKNKRKVITVLGIKFSKKTKGSEVSK